MYEIGTYSKELEEAHNNGEHAQRDNLDCYLCLKRSEARMDRHDKGFHTKPVKYCWTCEMEGQ